MMLIYCRPLYKSTKSKKYCLKFTRALRVKKSRTVFPVQQKMQVHNKDYDELINIQWYIYRGKYFG